MTEPTKATQLVEMALAQFRLGCSLDGKPFAVEQAGPNVALPLRGRGGLRSALAHAYFMAKQTAPGQNPLSEALMVLEGMAMVEPREPVAVRMAMTDDDQIVVDLARPDGQVVVIDTEGWSVVDRSPVLFRSTEAITELPLPVRGGDLEELHGLLNVATDDWPVLVAFSVAALFVDLVHPVLFFSGEQGTAKTSAARLVVRTFDGADTDVQSAPRNHEDWVVLASASWSVSLDNVSKIDAWLSDTICRASTGASSLKRALFTDENVAVLRVKRVVVLNGIDPEITRGDLAERLIGINLEAIDKRLTDEELAQKFTSAHPRILGALCTLAAQVLDRLAVITVPDPPRMASFAKILAAVDEVLGTEGLKRYRQMVIAQVAQAAEGDLFAQALERYLAKTGGSFRGTASELLGRLRGVAPDGRDELPKTPQGVGTALSRAAPSLRAGGWKVERGKSGARHWSLALPSDDEGEGRETGVQSVLEDGRVDTLDTSFTPIPLRAEDIV